MSSLSEYLIVFLLAALVFLAGAMVYVQTLRQNQMKEKTVTFIKNMETAAEDAIDEGLDEAFGPDSEIDDLMQLSYDLLASQNETNRLLKEIKELLEKK